jgi:hypothetical protein
MDVAFVPVWPLERGKWQKTGTYASLARTSVLEILHALMRTIYHWLTNATYDTCILIKCTLLEKIANAQTVGRRGQDEADEAGHTQ